MRSFSAFFKKECMEFTRTYKLFLMIVLFFILGVMNPLTARYTPELIKNFMPEGMEIILPEPSAADSWMQFFKNVPMMGLIVLVLVFSGMMAQEISKGTLINVLTKGLPRPAVVLSKFCFAVLIWTAAYFLCFGISYVYTGFFWDTASPHLLFSVSCIWVFGILLIALVLLGGIIFTNTSGTVLFTGICVILLFFTNMLPRLQKYNPLLLITANIELLSKNMVPLDFFWSIGITVFLTALSLFSAVLLFNRKLL